MYLVNLRKNNFTSLKGKEPAVSRISGSVNSKKIYVIFSSMYEFIYFLSVTITYPVYPVPFFSYEIVKTINIPR
jgi:hypothetical protein